MKISKQTTTRIELEADEYFVAQVEGRAYWIKLIEVCVPGTGKGDFTLYGHRRRSSKKEPRKVHSYRSVQQTGVPLAVEEEIRRLL